MNGWTALVPVVFAATAVVLLPGLGVGSALRLRGILLWGFAPAAGIAAIGVSATVLPLIGLRWSLGSAIVSIVVLIALSTLIGRLINPARLTAHTPRPGRMLYAAIAAGALLGAARMAVMIGEPGNLSQTNDATFHLDALRFIQDAGSASSLDLLGTTGGSGFYPAAWHAVTSLVIAATGTDIVSAANAMSLTIAGPIWALSISAFVWSATVGRRVATLFAAIMAPSLFAFPFHMLDFGVLYAFALALAVLPGVLAVLVAVVGTSPGRVPDSRQLWLAVTVNGVGLVAFALAQPSVILSWLIGAAVIVGVALCRGWSRSDRRARRRRVGGIMIVIVASLMIWLAILKVSWIAQWAPIKPAAQALVDMVLNDSAGPGPVITMSVLALLGLAISVRRADLRWLAVYGLAVSVLVLVAVSVQEPSLRNLLAPWYADPQRFIAMMPLVVIALAAVGADGIVSWVQRRGENAGRLAGAVLAALILVESGFWTVVGGQAASYAETDTSYLSTDEHRLLERLPELVEPDSRILGNPSAGAAYGYGLSGEDVVPRSWAMPEEKDFQLLRNGLVHLADDPRVCPAIERMGISHVLDFGDSDTGPGKWDMPGLTGFAHADGFEEVARQGDVGLWRITGCE